jgi:hypothetical protein
VRSVRRDSDQIILHQISDGHIRHGDPLPSSPFAVHRPDVILGRFRVIERAPAHLDAIVPAGNEFAVALEPRPLAPLQRPSFI